MTGDSWTPEQIAAVREELHAFTQAHGQWSLATMRLYEELPAERVQKLLDLGQAAITAAFTLAEAETEFRLGKRNP